MATLMSFLLIPTRFFSFSMDLGTVITTIAVAALASLPPTLVAWKGLINSRRNSEKQDQHALRGETTAKKQDEVLQETKTIHALANGTLAELTAELKKATAERAAAEERSKKWEEMVMDMLKLKIKGDAAPEKQP